MAARRNNLYLIDDEGRFAGVVNLHDVNAALRAANRAESVTARDLIVTTFPTTAPDESLGFVLERFECQQCERLPVLDAVSKRLLGTISKRDILSVYSLELLQRAARPRPTMPLEASVEALVDEVELPASATTGALDESTFRERYGLAVLMVSAVPYPSFKHMKLHKRQPLWLLVVLILVLKVLIARLELVVFTVTSSGVRSKAHPSAPKNAAARPNPKTRRPSRRASCTGPMPKPTGAIPLSRPPSPVNIRYRSAMSKK